MIPNGIGHFSQYASQKPLDANTLRDRVASVQDWLIHHTPNGIPALFHEEVLTGVNAKDATLGGNPKVLIYNPCITSLKIDEKSDFIVMGSKFLFL